MWCRYCLDFFAKKKMIFNSTIMILESIVWNKYPIRTPIANIPTATLELLQDVVQEDNTCFFYNQIRPIDSESFAGYGDVVSGQTILLNCIFVVNVNWIKGVRNGNRISRYKWRKMPDLYFLVDIKLGWNERKVIAASM